jgi:hypothetical protein
MTIGEGELSSTSSWKRYLGVSSFNAILKVVSMVKAGERERTGPFADPARDVW